MKSRPVRINESREHFVASPRPNRLELNDAGELVRLEADGSESVLCDAATGEPVLFDELSELETLQADSFTPASPTPPRRLSLEPTPTTPASAVVAHKDSAREGRDFARDNMTEAQRERLEARDRRRNT